MSTHIPQDKHAHRLETHSLLFPFSPFFCLIFPTSVFLSHAHLHHPSSCRLLSCFLLLHCLISCSPHYSERYLVPLECIKSLIVLSKIFVQMCAGWGLRRFCFSQRERELVLTACGKILGNYQK